MAEIKLDDLLAQETVTLPKYLIVKTDANSFFGIVPGDVVFEVKEDRISRMVLADDKVSLKALDDPEVVVAGNEIIYKKDLYKDPVRGLNNPVSVKLNAGDNKAKAMLDIFKDYVLGTYSTHAIVFATDIIAVANDATPASSAPESSAPAEEPKA